MKTGSMTGKLSTLEPVCSGITWVRINLNNKTAVLVLERFLGLHVSISGWGLRIHMKFGKSSLKVINSLPLLFLSFKFRS